MARNRQVDGVQLGSLMNDLGHIVRIGQGLRNVMQVSGAPFQLPAWAAEDDAPLIADA
ncbi:hypothetical protein [Luteimonas fraxinea]|nr:hypothetical protein [Luteimonas fraxinea]